MKILFINWNSFGNEDIIYYFRKMGFKINIFLLGNYENNTRNDEQLIDSLKNKLCSDTYDFIFSYNYFPAVSTAAYLCNTKYISWIYDSPYVQLFSNTLSNACNYVFLFDSALYYELKDKGFDTVYYLPMAANTARYDAMIPSPHMIEKYSSDISFIGTLYSDTKNNFYDRMCDNLSEYAHGFLNALIECQKNIYGSFILEKSLPERIIKEMILSTPVSPSTDGFENVVWIYANYFLARKVTALERTEILSMLPSKYKVHLYTKDNTTLPSYIDNKGYIDYYMQMPYVFKCSKINLNISLKSIQNGIPLRAIDIMGCGGFLLSNFQSDFMNFFDPDKDFVYYSDYDDLLEKIDYYLLHDEEREKIAYSGYNKIKQYHTYPHRIQSIMDCIQ